MSQRVLQTNPLNSYNMVHAGIPGVAKRKCIMGREWHVHIKRNTFLVIKRDVSEFIWRKLHKNPGAKSKWHSTVLLLKHILNSKTIFYIGVNEWLKNL